MRFGGIGVSKISRQDHSLEAAMLRGFFVRGPQLSHLLALSNWLRAHNFTPDSSAKLMRRAPGKVRCNSCVCAHVISEGGERQALPMWVVRRAIDWGSDEAATTA